MFKFSVRFVFILLIFLIPLICESRPRGYKTLFMLNSAEHEILNAHKCKNIKKFGFFGAQISLECYFTHS